MLIGDIDSRQQKKQEERYRSSDISYILPPTYFQKDFWREILLYTSCINRYFEEILDMICFCDE